MADTYKILAQLKPGANVLTDLYTVPAATVTIVSMLTVCNQGAATAYTIKAAVAGEADATKQATASLKAIAANATINEIVGATLGATDVLRVLNIIATCSFTLFGVEKT